MVVEAIKRLLFGGGASWEQWNGGEPVAGVGLEPVAEPDYDEIIAKLMFVRDELSRYKTSLTRQSLELREKLEQALAKGDMDTAEVIMADLKMKVRIATGVGALEKLLTVVIKRIESVKDMTAITKLLTGVYPMVEQITTYLATVSPESAGKLAQTTEAFKRVIRQTDAMAETMPRGFKVSEVDPEIKQMLAEAMRQATQEMQDLVPPIRPAVDYEVLEQKVLDYIRAHGGVIRLSEASRELGVSPKLIREVLYRLAQKGVITLSKGPTREASPA